MRLIAQGKGQFRKEQTIHFHILSHYDRQPQQIRNSQLQISKVWHAFVSNTQSIIAPLIGIIAAGLL